MSRNQAKYEKLQSRQNYPKVWHTELMKTCTVNPAFCCFAMCCGPCASYMLRKQALYNDMTRYVCCNGNCPCSGRMGERKAPECCLCLEVSLCFGQSVASTRWMIQDELRIQTTECDNCIIGTMIVAQYAACLCSIAACLTGSDELNELAQILDCIADILWTTVCACMQTQHKVELDLRDKSGGQAHAGPMTAPAVQMVPMPGPPPQPGYGGGYPPQGYPQQQPAYAPQGYPPQQPGYPPQGYPPQGYPQQQMYR